MEKTLLIGSTGFLGRYILDAYEGRADTLGRRNADIICDFVHNRPAITEDYQTIIHAAGKAHVVPRTAKQKREFYDVNVTGTENLLQGFKLAPFLPKSLVFISSVAVYGRDTGRLIDEEEALLATDPYGQSKIQAERLIESWCTEHHVICSILRLPLLAGTNPPGNLGAMIAGIKNGYYFNIAGGKARKSIVLAQDVAQIIPVVAKIGGTYNLTDRYHPDFLELSNAIAKQLGKSTPPAIPDWLANMLAKMGDMTGPKFPLNTQKLAKLKADLTFDDSKAVAAFGWRPTPVLKGLNIF